MFQFLSLRLDVSNNPKLVIQFQNHIYKPMMKQKQLSFELLEFPIIPNNPQLSPSQRTNHSQTKKYPHPSLIQIKIITLTLLLAFFCLFRFLYSPKENICIVDMLHVWTSGVNQLLNQNNLFYQVMLITAQQSIQINIFLLCIISTFKVKNLKAHLFMGLFYGIRGILLNIERFPYPPHIIWDAPIIPSFTVPYGISRDYFYSGHTGLMLFCTFWWRHLGYTYLYICSLLLTPVVILVLLATRVHYCIDIVAACIFTFWLQAHVLRHVVIFDKVFGFVLRQIHKVFDLIKNIFV